MNDKETYIGKTAYQGSIASQYNQERVDQPIWKREQAWMQDWVQRIPRGARVLDVPTGTGRFIEALLARGACVHAVDISEDMLAETRRRLSASGDSLVIRQGDAEALLYPDDYFDFVICWRLFHLLPADPAGRVLRELSRVCRGSIVLEVFGVEEAGISARLARLIRRRLGEVRRLVHSEHLHAAQPWSHITNYAHRERELLASFRACGLEIAERAILRHEQGPPARVFVLTQRESRP